MKIFVSRNAPYDVNYTDYHIYRRWSGSDFKRQTFREIIEDYIQEDNRKQARAEELILHTSNAMFLNFFSDEEAKKYFYIFRNDESTQRLFDFPEMLEKLTMMGPGEVVADTIIDDIDGNDSLCQILN